MDWIDERPMLSVGALIMAIVIGVACIYALAQPPAGAPRAEHWDLSTDGFGCTRSHETTTLIPMMVGKVMIMEPITSTVCDRYDRKA